MGCAMLHTQYSGLRSIIVCTIVCGMVLCNSFLLLPTAPSFVVTLTAFCLLPSACLFPDTRLIRVTTALLPFSFSFFFVLTTSLFASPHHHTTAAVDAERVLERYVCLPSALRPRRRLPPNIIVLSSKRPRFHQPSLSSIFDGHSRSIELTPRSHQHNSPQDVRHQASPAGPGSVGIRCR